MRGAISILPFLVVATVNAQTFTKDRSLVDNQGALAVEFPGNQGESFTSMPLPGGGTARFSIMLTRQDVPPGWSVWRNALQPKVLESPDGLSVTIFFPRPVAAFGVDLMPVWKKGRTMRMEIVDSGKSMSRFVKVDPGAEFFGFIKGHVMALRISKLPFDEGSFALGRMIYLPAH